ncbi:MAG: hypothetical protein GTO45_38615 [Candidatus Aminicenantes bacterium]|nr:hypothetical protein [Candidatus Aminicenantes bacterium]NIM84530.1 hypothetical protein [Candidatus Aminicenantes bacterium]NIN24058.1 hypothetical protein [Candidatus Aminicenantes bacterium]NIN47764.1 hypothetical protein [Candidatus Aminicenantes bacterium]NIN90702.1 hypothetical protein [Candidatus Aminicenantes bacterium]
MKTKMKKFSILSVLLMCFFVHGFGQDSRNYKFALLLEMDHMMPGDGSYRELYGVSSFLPTVRAEVKINNKNYVWGSFSFLKETGTTAGELMEPIESSQYFIGFGGAYRIKLSQASNLDLRYGGVWISYKEKAFQEEYPGDTFGLELGIDYKARLFSKVFIYISAAYIYGTAKTEETDQRITLGGVKTGLGLGIGF